MKNLRVDSRGRGRVRFAAQGLRFEVSKNGVNIYRRGTDHFGHKYEETFYTTRITRATLNQVLEAHLMLAFKAVEVAA